MIKTERLILRNYRMSDFEDYWEYVSQPDVGPRCGWPTYTDREKAKERLAYEVSKPFQFCIEYQGKVIGSIEPMQLKPEREHYNEFDPNTTREVGILLHKDFWGKGIMTEAMKAMVKYCFDYLHMETIVAGFFEPNIGSWRVQEKSGFSKIGRVKDYITWYETGEKCDLINTKITKEDYLKSPIYKDVKIQIIEEKRNETHRNKEN